MPEARERESIRAAAGVARPTERSSAHPLRALNGHWRQINPDRNEPALVAGGYVDHVVAIDVDGSRMALYATFGSVAKSTFGGDVSAVFTEQGALRVLDEGAARSIFPARPFSLDEGRITVTPPNWSASRPLEWSLRDGRLVIGDKQFERIDAATFNQLRRGEAAVEAPPETLRAGADTGTGTPATDNVEFFGVRSTGRHICYIVDVSGSMMGEKRRKTLDELDRSIRALPEGTKFFVLFFSDDKFVIEQQWLTARSAAVEPFLRRLAGVGVQGGTMPLTSIEHAFVQLSPRPDTIFFMTDGMTPQDVRGAFRTHNTRSPKVRVHTIAFGADADIRALEAIAAEHGGKFNAVR